MKLTLSWLREFTPLPGSPAEVAAVMDALGMAVEELVPLGVDGIVVARVLGLRPHPDADRIQLVDVDTGDGEALQICCGAFNMAQGDLVPLATVGTTMPGGMEIARRKLRGEWSNGMLCSAVELGLGADAAGIMVLPGDLDVGADLDEQLGLSGDAVFDLEINPNRPDAMSVAGVARDLAARLDLPFALPTAGVDTTGTPVDATASVELVAPDLCGRFVARVLRGVTADPSPLPIRMRLALCGMRPISGVVDASNYVMLELGAPSHAYDLARVPGGRLRVRRAGAGETVVTLDGVERRLAEGDGVICDAADQPIGLAGVMGGESTEIGPSTTDVLLEAAWWDPPSISRTARSHRLRSEASARFERGTDAEMLPLAVDRIASLLGVRADEGRVDVDGDRWIPPTVRVRPARVDALLGTDLGRERMRALLDPIGFRTAEADGDLDVEIPSWRWDSVAEIDVVEEVARHHGYDAIGRTRPRSPYPGRLTHHQSERRRVRSVLTGLGMDEAMALPLLGPDTHTRAGLTDEPVRLLNPLTAEESVLRTSLRPGLLRAVAHNRNRRAERVELFEIGHVVRGDGDGDLPDQPEHVAGLLAGGDARDGTRRVLALLGALGRDAVTVEAADDRPGWHPTRTARVLVGGDDVGTVGEVDPGVLEAFEIDGRVAGFELDLGRLLADPPPVRRYAVVSSFPSSDVDLAFVVTDGVPAGTVAATLREAGGDELVEVVLFDVYRDERVGPGRRSLAYRLRFQAADRTLTDTDLAALRQRCIDAVVASHDATLRG